MKFLEKIKAEEGDVIVLGSRPAMGKTAFFNYLIEENIDDRKVVYVSTDTKESILRERLSQNLRSTIKDFTLENLKIWDFTDLKGFSGGSLLEHFEDYDYPKGTILILDFIQMLASIGTDAPKYQVIDEILTKAKEIAINNSFIVIFGSQLSRHVEERQGHRPRLTDYSGASCIEEIPDHCLFLYRREYYDPMDKPGIAEIIVAKSRRGVNDNFIYLYDSKEGKFTKELNTGNTYD